uniref:Ig-like domain-containing protein n=1 Tax=Hucho hucho TaxID=62062 RepID=A0A4W5JMJ6_9TELE
MYCGGLELSQPSVMVVKPGDSPSITCKVSGYSVSDSSISFATGWVRKPAGKSMEWISHIWDNDASSNSVSLQGQSLQPEDTAVYYCVRYPPQ